MKKTSLAIATVAFICTLIGYGLSIYLGIKHIKYLPTYATTPHKVIVFSIVMLNVIVVIVMVVLLIMWAKYFKTR